MAKPNYAFEKRQKELAKKQKKQEKLEQRKAGHDPDANPESEISPDDSTEPVAAPSTQAES